ncbi:MAG: site-2 protease family protein [Candidatus Sulfotelmatobacter sp.]
MHSQIKLGRIAGIQIGLHYSWFIIALLIAFSLASHFHAVRPEWNVALVWTCAIVTSIFFFVALLLHELAHSIVAKSRGLRVRAITLFALGGVSQIESEAADAKSEFWIAIVGPLTSLLIGAVLVAGVRFSGGFHGAEPANPIVAVALWLGYINIALAVFNMIPGYPLDGGRVLRALFWWITKNAERSTRWASQVGQVVAFFFIFFGLYRFFVGASFGGLWIAFIGWFLLDAARSSYVQVGLTSELRGHIVRDIMQHDCGTVESYISLRDFVDQYLLHSGSRCFLVRQDHHVAGIVTTDELRSVRREEWDRTSVQSVMRPLAQVPTVPPDMPALKALEMMSRDNLNLLAVVSSGQLQGIFSRGQVLRFLQLHSGVGEDSHQKAA